MIVKKKCEEEEEVDENNHCKERKDRDFEKGLAGSDVDGSSNSSISISMSVSSITSSITSSLPRVSSSSSEMSKMTSMNSSGSGSGSGSGSTICSSTHSAHSAACTHTHGTRRQSIGIMGSIGSIGRAVEGAWVKNKKTSASFSIPDIPYSTKEAKEKAFLSKLLKDV